VSNPPDVVAKKIGKVAFLEGDARASAIDGTLLQRRFPGRAVTFASTTEVIDKVFKSKDFDIIHFTGHCEKPDEKKPIEKPGGLAMKDGTYLRVVEVGQLKEERTFTAARHLL
jgi:hypothetical protein